MVTGASNEALDKICYDYNVNLQGAISASAGYMGYSKTILTSVNQMVKHGASLRPTRF